MKRLLMVGTVITLGACGGAGADLSSMDLFCQQVLPAVDAFMA
jgi:hypothetical protein